MDEIVLPADLELGAATASWQVEGAVAERGRCIWDDLAEVPGAIVDGTTGEPACDHVHRLEEDLDLLAWLGVDAYRFSISWPRLQPGGTGPVSPEGLGFYERLVDGLLARGIRPVATLYHWDLPSELQATGGWPARDTAYRFAEYAGLAAQHLGDRVDRWATLNEPWCSAFLGYAAGVHAPGIRDGGASLAAAYHLILGHGLAVPAMRAAGARNIGIVLNVIPVLAETAEAEAAARHVDGVQNRIFLNLLARGEVPADVREGCRDVTDWSFVRDTDAPILSAPIDWVGENYYTVLRVTEPSSGEASGGVAHDTSAFPGAPALGFAARQPQTAMGWEIVPEGMLLALRQVADALPGVPLWICENGAAFEDVRTGDRVDDTDRVDYYRSHLATVVRAREEGIDLRGYYAWSLMDNIEWAEGMTKRFGIVRVEPGTLERVPKASAHWYRDRLASRA